jgi:peptidoglycan/LPS O-acetylase OafA/YrhL
VETFYWPSTRFWELTIGGALAYSKPRPSEPRPVNNAKAALGLALIFVSSLWLTKVTAFPGVWASLLNNRGVFNYRGGSNCLVQSCSSIPSLVGRHRADQLSVISVALAIVNLRQIVEGGTPSWQIRTILVFASAFLAALTFQFLERPTGVASRIWFRWHCYFRSNRWLMLIQCLRAMALSSGKYLSTTRI